MFSHNSLDEEAKLAAMQRVWQSRRSASTSFFEQPDEAAELLSPCVSTHNSLIRYLIINPTTKT